MKTADLLAIWAQHPKLTNLQTDQDLTLNNNLGSVTSMLIAGYFNFLKGTHLVIANSKDEALYLFTDLVNILGPNKVHFLPSSYIKGINHPQEDANEVKQRTETISKLKNGALSGIMVSYHDAVYEKIADLKTVKKICI